MQTRRKAKAAQEESAGFQNLIQNLHGKDQDISTHSGTNQSSDLVDASKKDIGKLLERVEERRSKLEKRQRNTSNITDNSKHGRKKQKTVVIGEEALFYQRQSSRGKLCESDFQWVPSCGAEARTELDPDLKEKDPDKSHVDEKDKGATTMERMQGTENITKTPEVSETEDGSDWEEGCIGSFGEGTDAATEQWTKKISFEIDNNINSKHVEKRSVRRATARDKEFAELVHKVHLLCLIGRGLLVNSACDDPTIKAILLSLVPPHFTEFCKEQKLTSSLLLPIVKWFQATFRVQSPEEGSSKIEKKENFGTELCNAIEKRSGSIEEIAAISVGLFRGLGLTARYVSILDVASLKPDSESMDASADWKSDTDDEDILNMCHMNQTRTTTASLGQILARCQPQASQTLTSTDYTVSKVPNNVNLEKHAKNINQRSTEKKSAAFCNKADTMVEGDVPTFQVSGKETKTEDEDETMSAKRKGDLEFEMQMAMALSATAVEAQNKGEQHANTEENKIVMTKASSSGKGSRSRPQQRSAQVWSRKKVPPLHWAEVYCEGESLTGKWIHVDAANGVVDAAQNVESTAASYRRPICYVLGFAGNGAKDVTCRYVSKWSAIVKHRVSSDWWDATLKPMEELESAANSEIGDRRSFEDMELATRTLTEPLPTSQQAFKNHHLYILERWLTKYQVLHPKGPILGYCAGQPVYPRSCVQNLHTVTVWLREGLQIKAGEIPVKVVKSRKQAKQSVSVSSSPEESCSEGNTVKLFGRWQTEPLKLATAVGGIVPKNERGQVDVWSEKCLPPGTVHLRLPRLVPLAKRLGINFAPAMVGFEIRNGRSVPVFDGIVVCEEFSSVLRHAHYEEEAKRAIEVQHRIERQAILRWNQLLHSIATRHRLQNTYEGQNSGDAISFAPAVENVNSSSNTISNDPSDHSYLHHDKLETSQKDGLEVDANEEHTHSFPPENQRFDEENQIWTKRCDCGFCIQVEEM